MKRLRFALALGLAAAACGGDTKPLASQSGLSANGLPPSRAVPASGGPLASAAPRPRFAAAAFHSTTDATVDAMLTADPVLATHLGDHRFDSRWPDTTKAGEEKLAADFRARSQALRALAREVPEEAPAAEAGTDRPALDAELLADDLEGKAFAATELHVAERHPSSVLSLVGSGITSLTSHAYAPKRARMDALATRLEGVPGLLTTARGRLVKPEKSSLELLPVIAGGLVTTLRTDLAKTDPKSIDGDTKLGDRLAKAALAAATAIEAYVSDVIKTYPAASAKDEPIGAASWSTLARLHEGVNEPPAEIRQMAEAEILRLEAELDALVAKNGKPGDTRAAFFTRLEQDPFKEDKLLDEYRSSMTSVNEWLKGHPMVTVPWEKVNVAVVQVPPERRGLAFAAVNPSGPLEPHAEDANFEVNIPDKGMPEARKKALLAFHARGAVDLVTIHEAIPGHVLQILANRATTSKVRKVAWAATLGEGWAHYCEQAVLDGGFTGKDPVRTRAFYLRMALQRATRVVMDVGENDGSLSPDDAAKLLSEKAFLAPEAAKMEARRAVLWPANMFTYTYGKLAIIKLRERVRAKQGKSFDAIVFHDKLLSLGAIPLRHAAHASFGE